MKERAGDLAYALYSSGPNSPSAYVHERLGAGAAPRGPPNTWTHLAATYDGDHDAALRQRRAARDGHERRTRCVASAGALRLGGNGIWGEWFAGQLDDVRIYDKALTAAQIQPT